MTAGELIRLIPEKTFQKLAIETKVDTQVKHLSGEIIFKLILFSMLNSEKLSLRVMETFLESAQFKSFTGYDILLGKYNSIRDRICCINAEYFEKLFATIFAIYNKELKEEKALSKTDSTYVSLAAKLFKEGMKNGRDTTKRFVKYSVNLKGSIPSSVKVFTDQKHVSEDVALSELINNSESIEGNIVVFDRGIQSRSSFESFTNSGKWFITRSKLDIKCNVIKTKDITAKPSESTVTIISDQIGKLFNETKKSTTHLYRIIKATIDSNSEPICFVTNMLDEEAYLITTWYKQRWEIETFFKFIKQHLNAKHLVSRDENGIKVMVYMTMILAILIIAYKKINRLKGFKIAKLKFELELENDIIKQIVVLCGGNPAMAPHLFSSA
jgi:DDE family transposase